MPRNTPYHRRGIYGYFLIVLLLFALYLTHILVAPFINTIILAIVIAACCFPLYLRLFNAFGNRAILASSAVIGILLFCIVLPLTVFISGLIPQAVESVKAINTWLHTTDFANMFSSSSLQPVLDWTNTNLPFLDIQDLNIKEHIATLSQNAGQTIITLASSLLGNTLTFFLHFLLLLLTVFFLLKDGKKLIAGVKYLCPMREEQEDNIIYTLRRVSRSVLVGGLAVAFLQGLVGGFGLAMVGIPALFWGTVMAVCSLIPVVGTGLVWIPATGYLLITGSWESALFLFLWCAIPVAAIDSFLRPYFMKGSSEVSIFFIFMSILGGIKAFGMLGILYGPLILSFTMVMLTIYGEEFKDVLSTVTAPPSDADEPHAGLNTERHDELE